MVLSVDVLLGEALEPDASTLQHCAMPWKSLVGWSSSPSFHTCTDRLDSLCTRMHEIMPPKLRPVQQTQITSHFDRCPEDMRTLDSKASERLTCTCNLLLNKPCVFLHVLVPDVGKIARDHTYSSKVTTLTDTCIVSPSVPATSLHDDENYVSA